MKFDQLVAALTLESDGMETYWEDGDLRVTIRDVIKQLDYLKIPTQKLSVERVAKVLINQDYEKANKKRVETANLDFPIIVVSHGPKYQSILDGNHRVFKAQMMGKKYIKGRVIDLDSYVFPPSYRQLFSYTIEPYTD